MRKSLLVVIAVLSLLLCGQALAQQPPAPPAPSASTTKCEGPADLCAQIAELQQKVGAQKALADKAAGEKTAEMKAAEQKHANMVAKMVALAATLAVLLKALLSALKSWKSFFTTDKGKAWLKVSTVLIGFLAFLLTNIGFGMPWWQAMIVAGGGPGSILVHELVKLIPVIRGKAPLPEDEKKSDPPAPPA